MIDNPGEKPSDEIERNGQPNTDKIDTWPTRAGNDGKRSEDPNYKNIHNYIPDPPKRALNREPRLKFVKVHQGLAHATLITPTKLT